MPRSTSCVVLQGNTHTHRASNIVLFVSLREKKQTKQTCDWINFCLIATLLGPLLIEKKYGLQMLGVACLSRKGNYYLVEIIPSRSSQSTNVVWPSIQLGSWWQSDWRRTSYMTGPLFSFSGERKRRKRLTTPDTLTHGSHTISTSLYRCGRCRRLSKTFVRPTFWRFLVWGRRKMFKTNDVRQAAALVKSIGGQTSYLIRQVAPRRSLV